MDWLLSYVYTFWDEQKWPFHSFTSQALEMQLHLLLSQQLFFGEDYFANKPDFRDLSSDL